MLSYGCPLRQDLWGVVNQNLTAKDTVTVSKIFSGSPFQNQFRIRQRIVVDKPVQFRPLETAVHRFVLPSGAVIGNYAAVKNILVQPQPVSMLNSQESNVFLNDILNIGSVNKKTPA